MTIGELALMFNEMGWLRDGAKCDLHVIKMSGPLVDETAGWRRGMLFDDTGLKWIPPSPNIPSPRTTVLYPGMCLLEATNFSEGRGTEEPFERVGAPWADSEDLIERLGDFSKSAWLRPTDFIPLSKPGKALDPKFKDTACHGLLIEVLAPQTFRSVTFGIHLLSALQELYPKRFEIRTERMNRLAGQAWVAEMLQAGAPPEQIVARCEEDAQRFREMRKPFLLYPESSR